MIRIVNAATPTRLLQLLENKGYARHFAPYSFEQILGFDFFIAISAIAMKRRIQKFILSLGSEWLHRNKCFTRT